MSNALYQKHALHAEGKNRIELTDSEQLALRDELTTQIIQHRISGLPQELIYAVFHKTIRLNKREDDLNGVCLGNLTSTGSRSDYINGHISKLISQSVLIGRLGFFGRILSINYNFEQWGKSPEYNRENGNLISDPEALLQTLDIPATTEEPEASSSAQECCGHSASTAPALQNNATLQEKLPSILSELLADKIPANLALLITEDLIKNAVQKIADVIATLFKDSPIGAFISSLINPQTQVEKSPEHVQDEINIPQTETENKAQSETLETLTNPENKAKQEPIKPLTNPEKTVKPEAKTEEPKTEEPKTEEPKTEEPKTEEPKDKESTTAPDYEQLIFPTELKPFEQNQIKKLLEKEAITDLNTVQTVLNSISSRYKVAMEPIKSPVAYFRSLLKSAQHGDFDNSYAEIYQQQQQEKERQEHSQSEQQQRRVHLKKYNEAKNNYEFIKLYAQNTGRSMREVAKDRKWLDLIEEMGFDLDIEIR